MAIIDPTIMQPEGLPEGFKPTNTGGAIYTGEDMTPATLQNMETTNLVAAIKGETKSIFPSFYNETDKKSGDAILQEMGQIVVEDYLVDEASRSDWLDNKAKAVQLFSSFMDPKTFPWDKCSNINLPFITIACIQFHSRAYDALFPKKDVIDAIATGDEDIPAAERVTKYMNYQLLYEMEEFEEGIDKTLIQLPIHGSVFRKTYYDPDKGRVTTSYVSADDFVINYGATSIEDAERKTHVLYKTQNEIRRRIQKGEYEKDAGWNLGPGSFSSLPSSIMKQVSDKTQGISSPLTYNNVPRKLLEQHRNWDLDGDGIAEPYVITVDSETQKVLKITDRTFVDVFGRELIIEYFTHYIFIPNPEGFYALGFGAFLQGLNEAANTIVNEVIDAGSLANLQGGFVSKRSGLKKGDLKFKIGEWKEVDTYLDDMRKAIYSFDFKGPNETLYAVLGLLYEYSKLVSSISETMTGQLPASDTPASTVLALIEEGRKVFSAIFRRIHSSFKRELKKIQRLNSVFLDDRVYFKILGDRNLPTGPEMAVGRADFASRLDVIPVSDPAITSRAEKVMKAQAIRDDIRGNPRTASDPMADYIATKRFYEALEIPNVDEVLKPPGPPPDVPPEEENATMFLEKPAVVLPEQDHYKHMKVHEDFMNGAFSGEMSPQAKSVIERHLKEHIAALYLQSTKQMQPEPQMVGGAGGI